MGTQSTFLLEQGRTTNMLSLRLIPRPDKYYLFEIIDDPRGFVETQEA